MTVVAVYPSARATAALAEYLAHADHGLAAACAALRTALGVTTDALPDPGEIIDWRESRLRGQSFPSVEILPMSAGQDREANQRLYPVRLQVSAAIPSHVVRAGGVDALIAAGWYYVDALYACLQNRARGEQGATLANGGTYGAAGRIVRAIVDEGRVLIDDEQIQRVYATVTMTVTVAEEY